MRQCFAFIMELSMVGTLLALIFWILQPLLRHRFSAAWHRGTICVLLAFFTVPVGAVLGAITKPLFVRLWVENLPLWDAFPQPLQGAFVGAASTPNQTVSSIFAPLFTFLAAMWSVVAIGLLFYRLLLLARFQQHLRCTSTPASFHFRGILAEEMKALGISSSLDLCTNAAIESPMVAGIIHNVILLPKIQISDEDLRLVLRHELMHIRHKDMWAKWLGTILCSAHWFNPCIWLLVRQLDSWMEKACDAAVVADMEPAQRRVYGNVILATLQKTNYAGGQGLYAGFSSNKKQMKERLSAMLSAKKHTKRVAVLSVFVLGALVVAGTLLGATTHQPGTTPRSLPSAAKQQEELPNLPSVVVSEAEVPQQSEVAFIWPVPEASTTAAGFGEYPGHTGMDIPAPKGTEVVAAAAGTVVISKNDAVGYGHHILVDHGGGYQTLYGHCDELLLKVGDDVAAGQAIATVGRSGNATGYHLHFEVRLNGENQNPEDLVTPPEK